MDMIQVEHVTRRRKPLSSFQLIVYGFLFVILTGALLLTLPCAVQSGRAAPFMDALFTATSAVCVTGLVVHDTATYWSLFGQMVILLMIQIGGMGVVTVAVSVAMVSGRKISLMQRSTMQEAIAAPQVGGIVRLTGFILKTAVGIELVGAAIMAPVFCRDFGLGRGLWYALFHAVSAFCNAGFDLMGIRSPYSSIVSYAGQPVVSLTISLLIVVGGIGFLTWEDVRTNRLHLKRYRMQSKVILLITGLLILLPTLYFYFIEFSSWNMPRGERVLTSLFQAITPRTAGFNSVELTRISEPGQSLLTALMLIGGSPGSTAGGMKTTTVSVLILTAFAVFHKKESAECFGRRLTADTVKYAAVVAMMYMVLFLLGGFILSSVEGIPMLSALFEAASAIGTVGLSLGVTPTLGATSRLVLIALMFFGRVGGLTLIFAVLPGTFATGSRLPQGKITVG
ncbi:MAG: potassium transporter TrkG [Eubacteriales bacterium]|nr:potassium transporter TrkG [Eubacteriales bacterium]